MVLDQRSYTWLWLCTGYAAIGYPVQLWTNRTAAMSDILFVSETRSKGSVMHKCISVEKVQNNLGEKACQQLLTAHALGSRVITLDMFAFGILLAG